MMKLCGLRWAGLTLVLLCSACLKDGVLPPAQVPEEGPLFLEIDLVSGSQIFDMAAPHEDGAGNIVRFTHLKFYLTGIHFYDDDSSMVADHSATAFLVNGHAPTLRKQLGMIANGHIHDIHFTAGLDGPHQSISDPPAGHPLADPDMQDADGQGRLHLLLRGYVDTDGDGHFDADIDQAFAYRPSGSDVFRDRHLHMHADMVNGEALTLGLRIDVRIILLGIDLMEFPAAGSDEPMAIMVMNNLVAAVMVRY